MCAALDAATTAGHPLRALALRKCHSVSAAVLPMVLMHAPLLQSLVCTALMLTDAALHALAGLRELRLLGLHECSASVSGLLGCVSRLRNMPISCLAVAAIYPTFWGGEKK